MRKHIYNKQGNFIEHETTPITESTFERQDWDKHVDESDDGEYYYFTLPLPKDNPDPDSPVLISSFNIEAQVLGLMDGNYLVEIADFFGLGTCYTEERLAKLYYLLTNRHIETK